MIERRQVGMLKWWTIAFIGMLTFAVPASAEQPGATSKQPSFPCAAARSQVEQAICASSILADADQEMAKLFALAKTSAFGTGPSNQLAVQRSFLRDIRACGKPSRERPLDRCIAETYARRNVELAVAVLMDAPGASLPVLRRLDPGAAPVLEATALWATEPADADWSVPGRAAVRTRIARLLQPYMAAMQNDEGQSFGRSILSDPGLDGITVHNVDDLFVSDRHFAAFLNVLGPYLPELPAGSLLTTGRRSLPCAAIVRHPALLKAIGSVFGSTMDNFVMDADCEQSLPPTPSLAALAGKLSASWPECDGTIRFAAYRGFESTLQRARLGRTEHQLERDEPGRSGVTDVEVKAARTELTGYYQTYLGKSAVVAREMAQDAIAAVLSDAHECGG